MSTRNTKSGLKGDGVPGSRKIAKTTPGENTVKMDKAVLNPRTADNFAKEGAASEAGSTHSTVSNHDTFGNHISRDRSSSFYSSDSDNLRRCRSRLRNCRLDLF